MKEGVNRPALSSLAKRKRQAMRPIAWIVGGFALSGLAKMLEGMGDLGTEASSRLPLYIPALLVLVVGQYCLYRGVRSGIAMMWSGAFDRRREKAAPEVIPAHRIADRQTDSAFDADAILARYLDERETNPLPPPNQVSAPQTARASFGRRIL